MIEAFSSDSFRQSLYWLGISCLLLAVGVVIVGFAYYGRTRDVYGSTSEKQRWTLLMFVSPIQRSILISRWLTRQRLSKNRSDPERETS